MFMPKAYVNGGWGASAIFMAMSGMLSCIACRMLIDVGLDISIFSYPLIVEKVLGKKSRFVLELAIAITQFGFVISFCVYLLESWKTSVDTIFDTETSIISYAVIVFIIFTAMTWVRDLAKFSFAFIFGVILVLVTVTYVIFYAFNEIAENGPGPDVMFINPAGYMNTIGYTIYCYEGIGIVMPIMATCDQPKRFKEILTYAFIVLIVFYISYPEIAYFGWGSSMDQPIITQMLP